MSTPAPHSHHSDDATADDAPPTDGITDEVRSDSAAHTRGAPETGDRTIAATATSTPPI